MRGTRGGHAWTCKVAAGRYCTNVWPESDVIVYARQTCWFEMTVVASEYSHTVSVALLVPLASCMHTNVPLSLFIAGHMTSIQLAASKSLHFKCAINVHIYWLGSDAGPNKRFFAEFSVLATTQTHVAMAQLP